MRKSKRQQQQPDRKVVEGKFPPKQPEEQHAVGATVPIAEPNAQVEAQTALRRLTDAQCALGVLRFDFLTKPLNLSQRLAALAREADLARGIAALEQEYRRVVIEAGKRLGLAIGPGSPQTWQYDAVQAAFRRVG